MPIPEPYKRLDDSEDIDSLRGLKEPQPLKPKGIIVGEKRVRTSGMWAGLIISIIILMLGVLLLSAPPYSSHKMHIKGTLEPQYYYYPSFNLSKGEKLIVRGYVRGGNDDIWIYIKEGRTTVKNFGRVKSPIDLTFTAPEDGVYTLYIDNSISVVTSKYVDLEVVHKYYDYVWGFLVLLVGLMLTIIVLIALAKGAKVLVLKIGDEVYEFMLSQTKSGNLLVKAKINGYELPQKLKPGDKFKIGPNDEHLLEIGLWHGKWFTTGVSLMVDGREVGRLP